MTVRKTMSPGDRNCSFACCCFWLGLTVFAPPGAASFTASFQPCDLPAVAPGDNGVLARCQVEFAGKSGTLELVGRAPDHVSEAVFRHADEQLVQRIPVSARPFIDPENVSVVVRDMNFDGMPDFGMRDFARTGANEPWRFWLWDTSSNRFVFHAALSKLPNPEASRTSDVVRAHVVDVHGNVTTITYGWRAGELVRLGSGQEAVR